LFNLPISKITKIALIAHPPGPSLKSTEQVLEGQGVGERKEVGGLEGKDDEMEKERKRKDYQQVYKERPRATSARHGT